MKERQILFSAPMVRALIAGTKTQTRRVVANVDPDGTVWRSRHRMEGIRSLTEAPPDILDWCPYGQPGDRLWVRETWNRTNPGGDDGVYYYRADTHFPASIGGGPIWSDALWRPSIFMPRAASRILLEVTDVRVERLQDISDADAIAEGIETMPEHDKNARPTGRTLGLERWPGDEPHWGRPQDAYAALWESINGAGSWDANPFVWAVSFRVLKGPQP